MTIRFGYCPPNPGPKSRLLPYIKWYNDVQTAIENYDGNCSIWMKTSSKYVEISYNKLLELQSIFT